MDADRLGSYAVMLQGLTLDDNTLAQSAYAEVEPAGHFLGCAHTMANYETAYYDATLSDSENVESWEERGAKDANRRAFERWTQMLKEYQQPAQEESIDAALLEFINRRKAELPDAWY